jgi:pyruvate dehydrogenase E1 component alpha subunit
MPQSVIGEYSVSRLDILDESGNVDRELEPDLSGEQLIGMYRAMLLARRVDERMLKLQRQGRIGTFGPASGQEACVIGPTAALNDEDWFVSSFRELGGRLARGDTVLNTLRFHNGFEEGNVLPEGAPPTPPINIIVASQTLHAVGIAYAQKYRGTGAVVLVTLGDGATSQGDFHEALNFASVWQVPVVFFCQNNQWAISQPRSRQTHSESIAQKAIAYDMPGIQVDGNDVLATYEATREAVERAREGGGPTLIEGVTYRMGVHTTADDPKRYRPDEEVETWKKRDPLIRFRKYLEDAGHLDDGAHEALEEEVRAEIEAGVEALERDTDYKPDAAFDHVYGTTHDVIEDQRREFLAHLGREASHG